VDFVAGAGVPLAEPQMPSEDQRRTLVPMRTEEQTCFLWLAIQPQRGRRSGAGALCPPRSGLENPVRVAVQDESPRIAALRHMVRNSCGDHPGESCHVVPGWLSLPGEQLHATAGAPHPELTLI